VRKQNINGRGGGEEQRYNTGDDNPTRISDPYTLFLYNEYHRYTAGMWLKGEEKRKESLVIT
jgi:hypothetical protein